MNCPKSRHQSVIELRLEPRSFVSPFYQTFSRYSIESEVIIYSWLEFSMMHKTSMITRPPTWTPNSYVQSLLKIYRWVSNIPNLKCPKPNSWFSFPTPALADPSRCSSYNTRVILNSSPFFTSFIHISPYLVSSTFKHIKISIIKYWRKKIFRIWLTTPHLACHCRGPSYQSLSLLDYYEDHLSGLPAFIFAPGNLFSTI